MQVSSGRRSRRRRGSSCDGGLPELAKRDRQKVVVVFDDGSRLKGLVDDFRPERARFVLREVDIGGQVVRTHDVDVHQVLAAFFVRDLALFQDTPVRAGEIAPERESGDTASGRSIRATFVWGETMDVVIRDQDPRRRWLVLQPLEASGRAENVERIFATRRAIAALAPLP